MFKTSILPVLEGIFFKIKISIFRIQLERQEIRPCTDILNDVLTFLHLRRGSSDVIDITDDAESDADVIARDVGVVAESLLHSLVQTILVSDRSSKSASVVRKCFRSAFEIFNNDSFNSGGFHGQLVTERSKVRFQFSPNFLLF